MESAIVPLFVVQWLSHLWLLETPSTRGFPLLHYLPKFAQTHVHWISDAIQPSHPLSPLSPPVFNLSQHQGLFQRVSSLHQVAKVLELQHQSFQWISGVDFRKTKYIYSTFMYLWKTSISGPVQFKPVFFVSCTYCREEGYLTWAP